MACQTCNDTGYELWASGSGADRRAQALPCPDCPKGEGRGVIDGPTGAERVEQWIEDFQHLAGDQWPAEATAKMKNA